MLDDPESKEIIDELDALIKEILPSAEVKIIYTEYHFNLVHAELTITHRGNSDRLHVSSTSKFKCLTKLIFELGLYIEYKYSIYS